MPDQEKVLRTAFVAGAVSASLMLGWTALLAWADKSPIERRFVAALTVLVICGLVLTEVMPGADGR